MQLKTLFFISTLLLLALQTQAQLFSGIYIQGGVGKPFPILKKEDFPTNSSIVQKVKSGVSSTFELGTSIHKIPKMTLNVGAIYSNINIKQSLPNLKFGTDIINGTTTTLEQIIMLHQVGLSITASTKHKTPLFFGIQCYKIFSGTKNRAITGAGASEPFFATTNLNKNIPNIAIALQTGFRIHIPITNEWNMYVSPILRWQPPMEFFIKKYSILEPQLLIGLSKK